MTVAEYQQAQKDIAEIRGQIAQLRDVVAKGVPAMRGVYGLDQPEAQPPIAGPQQAPQMMSAHEQVGTPNVNPFQDNFTPSTNVKSMQEIAGQIAPQIDQPLGERIARGAMNLPVGMAAMAEQATSDPAGFAKGTAEYADTWMKRLNPNLMSPEAMVARTEFGQQLATDPVGTGLDALGVAGTALGLPGLGGKIKGFKSIKEARAAIKDIGKPKVDVPEVVQEPIRSETPKADLSQRVKNEHNTRGLEETTGTTPIVIEENTGRGIDRDSKGISKINREKVTLYRGETEGGGTGVAAFGKGLYSTTDKTLASGYGKVSKISDGYPQNPLRLRQRDDFSDWLLKESGYRNIREFNKAYPNIDEFVRSRGYDGVHAGNVVVKYDIPQQPTTATEVVAKAKPNAVTKDVKTLTPEELTAAQARLREKFKPMDEVTKPQTPQTITEDLSQGKAKPTTAKEVVAKTKSNKAKVDELEELKKDVRKTLNQKFDNPKDRADAIERGKNLIDYHEGKIRYPESYPETYRNGDRIGFTGGVSKDGAREYIILDGHKRGQYGYTYEGTEIGTKLKADKERLESQQRDDFRRLNEINNPKSGAGKISTEQPTATVKDAGATLAQSTTKAKEPWEMSSTSKEYASIGIDELDRNAFGFASGDIKTLTPDQLNVKYKDDMLNPRDAQKRSGLSPKKWAETIDLSEPIDVSFENGKFWIEDGHHRYSAAKILNKPLNVGEVTIKDKPHKTIIKKALADGKPVPPEVLSDYPDLAAKYGKPTTAEAAVKKAGEKKVKSPKDPITAELKTGIDEAIADWHKGFEKEYGVPFGEGSKQMQDYNANNWGAPERLEFRQGNGTYKIKNSLFALEEFKKNLGGVKGSPTAKNVPLWLQRAKEGHDTNVYAGESPFKFKKDITDKVISGDNYDYAVKELKDAKDSYKRAHAIEYKLDNGEITVKKAIEELEPGSGYRLTSRNNVYEYVRNVRERFNRAEEKLKQYEDTKALVQAGEPPLKETVKFVKGGIELHAGVNPFKIIDDYMAKRKLVNPLGTPEVVLRGKDIIEPFRSANDLMRDDLVARGEKLKSMLEGVKRESPDDYAVFGKLDDPKAVLPKREQEIRTYLDELFSEVNKHRADRGQPLVKYREGYITHLPTDAKMSEILDVLEKATADYGDTPMPKKFRFQFEKARKGDLNYKMSAIDALEVYTQAALKDIYIGDALAKAVPNIEKLGGKPLLVKNVVKTPDGKTINITEYRWTDSPIVTERGYAEAFIKGQMNVPTMGQRTLKAMFDIRPNTSMKVAHATTGAFYRSLLGFAMDSGVKNLTQNLNTLAEYGVAPTLKGAAKFITPEGFKAAKAQHLLDDFNPMLLEGHDLPMKSKVGRAIGKGFAASLNAPMKVAEFINRGIAYHTAFDVNLKKGLPVEAAHDLAREGVRKTQFSYSKMDTSPALRGPFARLATQFLSYPIKQSELMYQWATKPGEQGKLVRYFLYTGMAVVGAKYAGVDLSGVFFDPIKMVDPNSKEGMELPWSDKRVKIDWTKFGQSGYTPRGFTPIISIPKDFVESQMSDDESTREYGRTKALANVLPGGRYGKKVYDVITESDEKGKRDRLTRENTTKDKILKLLGGKSTDREAESSRRETVNEVEKKYYSTRQKLIDLKISGNEDEFIKIRDEFRDKYPFLYGRLMKGFADAVKEERKKKGMTTDERFFDNSLRKQIDANL